MTTTKNSIDEVGVMTLQAELLSRLQKDVLLDETLDERISQAIYAESIILDYNGDYIHRASGEYVTKSEMTDIVWPVVEEWSKTASTID